MPISRVMQIRVRRLTIRLLIAGLISGSGLVGTSLAYRWTDSQVQTNSSGTVIAKVIHFNNEAQRKAQQRLIWQDVRNDELLSSGQSLRTGPKSEARIAFLDENGNETGVIIELDSDSLVVIERDKKKLALDFIKGNLFVKSTAEAASSGEANSSVTVLSGENSISLTGADAALARDSKGQVGVQVFGGKATVQSGEVTKEVAQNQKATLSQSGVALDAFSIDVLSPARGAPIYLDPKTPRSVRFQWKPLSPAYDMILDIGTENGNSHLVEASRVSAEKGVIEYSVSKVGMLHWRLRAVPKSPGPPEVSTLASKLPVLPILAPLASSPSDSRTVLLRGASSAVKFEWANPGRLRDLRIEVARMPSFAQVVATQPITSDESQTELEIPGEGLLHWRVSGLVPGANGTAAPASRIYSDARTFELKRSEALPAPALARPSKDETFPFDVAREKGILIEWHEVDGAKAYRLKLNGKVISPESSLTSTFHLFKPAAEGAYAWSVESQDQDGSWSGPSDVRVFNVREVQAIRWASQQQPDQLVYLGEKPSVVLDWDSEAASVAKWRFKWSSSAEGLESAEWRELDRKQILFEPPTDGNFVARVEGMAGDGSLLARSPVRAFSLKRLPPPAAPQFAPELPAQLQAQRNGQASLAWTPVAGAESYLIELKAPNGQVKAIPVVGTSKTLTGLEPGTHQITIYADDVHKRRGPASETRSLSVPATNGLSAPKLKRVKIK